ncbi:uncharacterized protein EV422DRAFT_262786 [Fimicolochytrium jonesii]|uniref:uncharacterized protein n=1 Tax=Fimicolochytrium jonesii TaxID=1396493 RepID=UPI0022FF1AD6|nr:uncharacterized protein EV422DRAFT_262786 [Fimicolochytrium jonesii]KAI8817042.1 hypothetical protein EV422DRAFT_262786 [Fimicolochytrium jonesii]
MRSFLCRSLKKDQPAMPFNTSRFLSDISQIVCRLTRYASDVSTAESLSPPVFTPLDGLYKAAVSALSEPTTTTPSKAASRHQNQDHGHAYQSYPGLPSVEFSNVRNMLIADSEVLTAVLRTVLMEQSGGGGAGSETETSKDASEVPQTEDEKKQDEATQQQQDNVEGAAAAAETVESVVDADADAEPLTESPLHTTVHLLRGMEAAALMAAMLLPGVHVRERVLVSVAELAAVVHHVLHLLLQPDNDDATSERNRQGGRAQVAAYGGSMLIRAMNTFLDTLVLLEQSYVAAMEGDGEGDATMFDIERFRDGVLKAVADGGAQIPLTAATTTLPSANARKGAAAGKHGRQGVGYATRWGQRQPQRYGVGQRMGSVGAGQRRSFSTPVAGVWDMPLAKGYHPSWPVGEAGGGGTYASRADVHWDMPPFTSPAVPDPNITSQTDGIQGPPPPAPYTALLQHLTALEATQLAILRRAGVPPSTTADAQPQLPPASPTSPYGHVQFADTVGGLATALPYPTQPSPTQQQPDTPHQPARRKSSLLSLLRPRSTPHPSGPRPLPVPLRPAPIPTRTPTPPTALALALLKKEWEPTLSIRTGAASTAPRKPAQTGWKLCVVKCVVDAVIVFPPPGGVGVADVGVGSGVDDPELTNTPALEHHNLRNVVLSLIPSPGSSPYPCTLRLHLMNGIAVLIDLRSPATAQRWAEAILATATGAEMLGRTAGRRGRGAGYGGLYPAVSAVELGAWAGYPSSSSFRI